MVKIACVSIDEHVKQDSWMVEIVTMAQIYEERIAFHDGYLTY